MPVREAGRRRRSCPAPAASRGAPLPALTARGRWLRARPAPPLCGAPPPAPVTAGSVVAMAAGMAAGSLLPPAIARRQRAPPPPLRSRLPPPCRPVRRQGAVAVGRSAGAFGVFFLPPGWPVPLGRRPAERLKRRVDPVSCSAVAFVPCSSYLLSGLIFVKLFVDFGSFCALSVIAFVFILPWAS